MSSSQQSLQHSDDGTTSNEQASRTLDLNGTMEGFQNRSTRYDGSLSRARSEAEHYESGYNKAVKEFCCDPDRRSLDVLSAYSRSFIETLGDQSAQERKEADETMASKPGED